MNARININSASGNQYTFSSYRLNSPRLQVGRALYIYAYELFEGNCTIHSIAIADDIRNVPAPNNGTGTHILIYLGDNLEFIRADIAQLFHLDN